MDDIKQSFSKSDEKDGEGTAYTKKKYSQEQNDSERSTSVLEHFFSDTENVRADVESLEKIDQERAWGNINRAVEREEEERRGRRRRVRRLVACASVASITLIVGVTLLNFLPKPIESQEEEPLATIYEPGMKRATLKMSDGRVITLGDGSGEMVERDSTLIKIENGETRLIGRDATEISPPKLIYNTLEVERGAEFSLVLSDGSRVFLNSESEITFPTQFHGSERRVKIGGEAYLEVVEDSSKPFIVECDNQKLRVLGTSFNLSAYPDDAAVVTTLIDGSVAIETAKEELVMRPGTQSVLNKESDQIVVRKVDAKAYAEWTKGVFVFVDESVVEICKKLSRWYDVDIDTSSPTIRGKRFTGVLKRYETFNEITKLMMDTNEIEFIDEGYRIVVLGKKRPPS